MPRRNQQVGKDLCPKNRNHQKAYSVEEPFEPDQKDRIDSTERITRKPNRGARTLWPHMKSWWYAFCLLVWVNKELTSSHFRSWVSKASTVSRTSTTILSTITCQLGNESNKRNNLKRCRLSNSTASHRRPTSNSVLVSCQRKIAT